jgi:Tfp pilus assembly protein PilN
MMRINLLPPEILEKRRAERRIIYVAIAAVLIFAVLGVVWVFSYMRVDAKQQDLDVRLQEIQATQAKADMLAVFEQKEQDLQARKAIAEAALAGRKNWAKLFDELSLVMPTDIWITSMAWGQESGLGVEGFALDSGTDSPDYGHKTIAKLLVRLADLDGLFDVWLSNSVKTSYLEDPVIQFSATAQVGSSLDASATPSTSTTP